MLELAADLLPLLRAGTPVAVVTVAEVARSAPRGVGAAMAVTADARVIGSISGGCVEGDSVMLALDVLRTGTARRARFGFSDEAAHAAGLACGGSVEVLCIRLDPEDATVLGALSDASSGAAVSLGILASGPHAGSVVAPTDPGDPGGPIADAVRWRESRMLPGAYEGYDLLVVSRAPAPRLLIVGAGEHAAALCRVATAAGFAVSVCDVWPLLATPERFPDAREVVAAIPHEWLASLDPGTLDARTAVCVLSHDERVDVPSLVTALRMPVGFVGAMGARSTVAHRLGLLRAAGVDDVSLSRLHSPLGLDLGGAAPEESAVSVLAEIVASRHGGSGMPLRDLDGPLHARDAVHPRSASPRPAAPAASCTIPVETV